MLKRAGTKFKPKVAPRAPRPVSKVPLTEKTAQLSAPTETASPQAKETLAAPQHPTSPYKTPSALLPISNSQQASPDLLDNEARNETLSEEIPSQPTAESLTTAPPTAAPPTAALVPLPTPASTQQSQLQPSSIEKEFTPQQPRSLGAKTSTTARRRQSRNSTSPDRHALVFDEERPHERELTIQEAIAINVANKEAQQARRERGSAQSKQISAGAGRKRKSRSTAVSENKEVVTDDGSKPRIRRRRTAAPSRKTRVQDAGDENNEDGERHQELKKVRSSRKRALTPENAEEQVVNHKTVTLADVTRDLGIGRKFSKHDELLRREKETRAKKKQERKDRARAAQSGEAIPSGEGSSREDNHEWGGVDRSNTQTPGASGSGASGEQQPQPIQRREWARLHVVDGQLVVDESSLQINRHAHTMQQDLPEVEEDEFSHLTTSLSHMPADKTLKNPWTAEETDLFYRLLGMFGTDFLTISRMFPGKNRRQVKLKYNREERCNPQGINAALVGSKAEKMDLSLFERLSQRKLRSVEEIREEHNLELAELERKETERRARVEEDNRRKQAEVARGLDEEAQKQQGRKKRRKKGGDDNTYRGEGSAVGGGDAVIDSSNRAGGSLETAFGRVSSRAQSGGKGPAFGSVARF